MLNDNVIAYLSSIQADSGEVLDLRDTWEPGYDLMAGRVLNED